MKIKNFVGIFVLVLLIAAFAVVPAFAQGANPPAESPPAFDLAEIAKTIETLIALILLPSVTILVNFISTKSKIELGKLSNQQKAAFDVFLRTLVFAAEQMKAKEFIENKLQWVTDRAEEYAYEKDFPIDLDGIRVEIEAIVAHELNYIGINN